MSPRRHVSAVAVRIRLAVGSILIEHLVFDVHNYFDSAGGPVPARGPIELQTHRSAIRFRNICVKEVK